MWKCVSRQIYVEDCNLDRVKSQSEQILNHVQLKGYAQNTKFILVIQFTLSLTSALSEFNGKV